jgi:hypothetical protein
MSGLATKLEIASRLQIELRTRGRQLTNARRTFFDEDLDRFGVCERRAGCQSVLSMQLG